MTEPLRPLSRQSVADDAYTQLRTAIQDGSLQPGTRLVERRIAAQFHISHIPVREALARLSDDGLVERAAGRGARVASLGRRELEEISSVRVVLEQLVAVRAQTHAPPGTEDQLRSVAAAMAAAAVKGDRDRVADLDREFHERLWTATDHQTLIQLVEGLRGRIAAFLRRATYLLEQGQLEAHTASHVELIDAIFSGDPERARAKMAEHIQIAAARVDHSLVSNEGESDGE